MMKSSALILSVFVISLVHACHYRTAYLSASDNGNQTVGFTIKIARSNANCGSSEYATVLFDQGLGAGYQTMNQNTITDIANYQLFLNQTYQYTIGGNTTFVYTATGPLQYPSTTTVVDAAMELRRRNTNVQNLIDTTSLSQASVHLVLGSGYTAPQVYVPDIIYLPYGVNVANYQLGVYPSATTSCLDVTANNGQLSSIQCGTSSLTVNPNCTISWDLTNTASCQVGMQWYIRYQATDTNGNSITMETVVAIVSDFGTVNVVSFFDSSNNTACQANGVQDPNEGTASSIPIQVQILGPMAITNQADFTTYLVASGNYAVQVILPPGYTFTLYHVGPSSTWSDILPNGQATLAVTTNQTTTLRIGVVAPAISFKQPNSTTIWKMYYAQRIEWCHSMSIGSFNMTIYVMRQFNATYSYPATSIYTFWDGVPGSFTRHLLASDSFTTWIPHNQIPGIYFLDAKYVDTSNRTYDFYSEKFYWGVHV